MNLVVARLRKFLEESTLNVFIREVRGLKLFFLFYEFRMARFVKRYDNACLQTIEI